MLLSVWLSKDVTSYSPWALILRLMGVMFLGKLNTFDITSIAGILREFIPW